MHALTTPSPTTEIGCGDIRLDSFAVGSSSSGAEVGFDVSGFGSDAVNVFESNTFDATGFGSDTFDVSGFGSDTFDNSGFGSDTLDVSGFGSDTFTSSVLRFENFDSSGTESS